MVGAAWAVSITMTTTMSTQVFDWMVDHQLTRYTSVEDFRPQDPIVRGEAAKFYVQYAQQVDLESWETTSCSFDDIAAYDTTLTADIMASCKLWLFKWYQWGFHPRDNITYAQALAVTIRSIDGRLDESWPVWYQEYLARWKEIWLLDDVSVTDRDGQYITRAELANWLYITDQYRQNQSNNDEWIVYEIEVDWPQDCTSYEEYYDTKKLCYYQCDTELECSQIQDQIDQELVWWTNSLSNDDRSVHGDDAPETSNYDAVYKVSAGEQITLASWKDDTEYQTLRKSIADLSPDMLSDIHIDTFAVYRKDDDTTAYVVDENGDDKRQVTVNLTVYNSMTLQEQKASLIHELWHIITLNQQQMDLSWTCTTYKTDEWCLAANSYLNQFVSRFWKWISNPAYDASKYVTEYATTSPEEDIAESFAFFVLSSSFSDVTTKDQKMNLFTQYPEMMEIRASMRSVLGQSIIRAKKQ